MRIIITALLLAGLTVNASPQLKPAAKADSGTLEIMQSIIIPELSFDKANIRDAISHLQQATHADPCGKSLNFYLKLPADYPAQPGWWKDIAPAPANTNGVTFSALNITLEAALDITTDIAKLKYTATNGLIRITPINAPDGPIIRKSFAVISTTITHLQELCDNRSTGGDATDYYSCDLKEFFGDMGVQWPIGSSIRYIRGLGRLFVANTRENMDKLESCLYELNVIPYLIETTVSFVAFDKNDITKLGPNGATADTLMKLWQDGRADLLAAPTVLTQSGQQATIKGVTECIYPTELCFEPATATNNNVTALYPASFETREVGSILDVLPESSPDGGLLNITLSPELTESPAWTNYSGQIIGKAGPQQTEMRVPFFHAYALQSSVLIENGATQLISGGVPSRDRKQLVYIFMTARRVGADGKPVNANYKPPAPE